VYGWEVLGIYDGYDGLMMPHKIGPLTKKTFGEYSSGRNHTRHDQQVRILLKIRKTVRGKTVHIDLSDKSREREKHKWIASR